MRIAVYLGSLFWSILLSCLCTQALEVTKSVRVHASADVVWQKIGGFCTISVWHPIFERCEQTQDDGVVRRVLIIAGGAKMKERLTRRGTYRYSTLIEDSPFPVGNFRTTIKVEDDNDEMNVARITWTGSFDAKGTSKEQARDIIEAVYEAGLIHIRRLVNKGR